MVKKKISAEPSGVQAGQRVAWLLKNLWAGNQAAMSQEVGCSRTAIYKIVTGKQPPGRRLLAAIASHPKVSPAWLLAGEGDPLLAERKDTTAGGMILPIAKRPLPGAPSEHADMLSGESFPVAQPFYRVSRYWLEIQRTDPIAKHGGQSVAPGDLLLMETDPLAWNHLAAIDQQLAIVRVSAKQGIEYKLGKLTYIHETEEEPEELSADTFERTIRPSDVECEVILRLKGGELLQARTVPVVRRPVKGNRKAKEATVPVPYAALVPEPVYVEAKDIVATCIMIVRRCGG